MGGFALESGFGAVWVHVPFSWADRVGLDLTPLPTAIGLVFPLM
ncbi:Uncharacterised protein [Mycobacteroides abscessus subsp. abscessus]|nr:Uncharacterised protein [Mycobacteroides abscessus]SHP00530.1 Uncharacterised protein [Mycobacteroides abscessus subsp. abscessus]CPX08094.1 Uncharacterised protein [Mycobacteroides abscessus]CQA03944.1 Uncharacterised protein [Mycobacteroides abscessus]SHQ02950.1 Uncharacterised protein [Mycobacteroides abscessus subsp. abscessus]